MFLPVKHKLQSSHFFVSAVEMVSKCLLCVARRRGRSLPCVLVQGVCSPRPSLQQSAALTAAPGPQTAVVCSSVQGGEGGAPQSLSPQLTKMCHFIIISGCQQCSSSSNPLCVHLGSRVRGLDSQKSPPAWPSRSFAFTQRSSVAKTQTSLSLAREEYSQLISTFH